MDKSAPFTHPPDDWVHPGQITEAERIAMYKRDRDRDRKCIAELEGRLEEAKDELSMYANGYKGGCYACEPVGEQNLKLRAKLERLEKAMLYAIGEIHCDCRKGYNCAVCVLTEALVQDNGSI